MKLLYLGAAQHLQPAGSLFGHRNLRLDSGAQHSVQGDSRTNPIVLKWDSSLSHLRIT